MDSAWDFVGTERFAVLRRIGSGGMGVVYEARDRQQGNRVALKVLRHLEPGTLLRFKQEFRALADVNHPNLVGLHELVGKDGLWFVTMELVEGVDFLHWVRPGLEVSHAPSAATGSIGLAGTLENGPDALREAEGVWATAARPKAPLDENRLRDALRQLVDGVSALHGLGMLHRDIKPSNVLVTGRGRVVLLDFGLVKDLVGPGNDSQDTVVGTIGYMAPEQAAADNVTEASDWYSVGVMLYEALTGQLPFEGNPFEILIGKQQREPTPPGELAPGLPRDLESLCRELLGRDPSARPSGAEILRRLVAGTAAPARRPGRTASVPLVGRRTERAMLEEAFAIAAAGTPVNVVVSGASGMGKSTLVRGFLEEIDDRAVVLAGRCYERESVPYKAVDSLVDALCRHLLRLPAVDVAAVLPRDMAALARVFPVLNRIGAIAAARRDLVTPDVTELRRRAFGGLRELLARMADRRPLVLFIDDLQWGDADSAVLLRDLLAPPDPPALLLICCQRADAAASQLVATLLTPRAGVEVREVALAPLQPDEARALARTLLDQAPATTDERLDRVAREAHGNPFLLVQLAQHLRGGAHLASGEVRFENLMRARLDELSADARRLLELIAVAGCPVPKEVARDAAGLAILDDALAPLRAGELVRTGGTRSRETVECYHDRIAETVAALLDPADAVVHHGRLARALETAGADDPEAVSLHYHAAGELESAGRWAEVAAERAAAALAFDHAAELYRRALSWKAHGHDERRELTARLAAALAGAGRGKDAADAYLVAAAGARRDVALARRQRAAHHLLRAGYVDLGEAALAEVLAAHGVRTPRTRPRMLAAVLLHRLRIWARGYGFAERAIDEIPADALVRIDACWSAATGLSAIDFVSAAYYQSLHLRGALRLGEPSRVAEALALEAGTLVAMSGPGGEARAVALLASARELATRADDARVNASVTLLAGIVDVQLSRFRAALAWYTEAEAQLRASCADVAWELDSAQLLGGLCLARLGRLDDIQRLVPRLLREAETRGDLYLAASVPGFHYPAWLAADQPDELRAAERTAMARWTPRGYHVQHFTALQARVATELYVGDGAAAWQAVEADWPRVTGSLMFKSYFARLDGWDVRGRAALGAAARHGAGAADGLLRVVFDCIRRLEREASPHARAIATSLRAGAAHIAGDDGAAAGFYAGAETAFDGLEMAAHAAAARHRRGELVGGDQGAALVADAERWLARERVKAPDRFVAALAPGPPSD